MKKTALLEVGLLQVYEDAKSLFAAALTCVKSA